MAGNKQVVAVFLMCIAVVAALHLQKAEATDGDDVYGTCFNQCHKDCFQDGNSGNGYTYCEMKCDTECGIKALKEKVKHFKP